MARYNTIVNSTITTAASATIPSPSSGTFTEFTSSTTAATIGSAVSYPGQTQTFYNATGVTVTITSGGGNFIGPGGSSSTTFSMANGTVLVVNSDGTNWVVAGPGLGPHAVTTLDASGTVTLNPASTTVTISPTGGASGVTISPTGSAGVVINPTSAGTINNMSLGQSTRGAANVTSLDVNSTANFSNTTTLQQVTEVLNTKTGATGTVTHDWSTGDLWYHSSIASNFTANFTNMPTTANRTFGITLILNQGGTGYYPNAVQVNSGAVTLRWANNVSPTPGINKFDTAAFTLVYTGSTWYCLGQYTSFA
jgi:hypothetical protein